MKELIDIVNNKLQAVIDDLQTQRETLESKVKTVVEDIDKKVAIASQYKESVEKSNNTITELEDGITKLKKDLRELHEKFDSAGFKELLEAGNREINGKVIEYNTKIAEEQDNIKKYQEEASNLRDELISLKDSKINLETELNNTIVAINYYGSRIQEISNIAIENADTLSDLTDEDDSLDDTITEDVDVNKVIDGTIFEEIDEISAGKKELSEEELNNILNEEKEEEVKEEVETETESEQEESNTEDESEVVEINVIEPTEEEIEESTEESTDEVQEDVVEDTTQEEDIQEPTEEVTTEEVEDTNEVVETETVKEVEEEPTEEVQEDVQTEEVVEDQFENNYDIFENRMMEELDSTEEIVNEPVVEEVNEEVQQVEENINSIITEPIEQDTTETNTEELYNVILQLGYDPNKFDDKLNNIKSLDYNKSQMMIDTLDAHNINLINIYDYPQILVTMDSTTLDKELDILESAGCLPSTISLLFSYLDKIDVYRLKDLIKGPVDSIISVLYEVGTNLEVKDIGSILGLTQDQLAILKSRLDPKQYNVMCTFPEVISANYDTLKGFHVIEPVRCITEHPKRFLFNPEIFEGILDKYDPQDLVRCINKNPAVIDKL